MARKLEKKRAVARRRDANRERLADENPRLHRLLERWGKISRSEDPVLGFRPRDVVQCIADLNLPGKAVSETTIYEILAEASRVNPTERTFTALEAAIAKLEGVMCRRRRSVAAAAGQTTSTTCA